MHVRIIYEKRKRQVPLGPLLGKQNIQAKEVFRPLSCGGNFVPGDLNSFVFDKKISLNTLTETNIGKLIYLYSL